MSIIIFENIEHRENKQIYLIHSKIKKLRERRRKKGGREARREGGREKGRRGKEGWKKGRKEGVKLDVFKRCHVVREKKPGRTVLKTLNFGFWS